MKKSIFAFALLFVLSIVSCAGGEGNNGAPSGSAAGGGGEPDVFSQYGESELIKKNILYKQAGGEKLVIDLYMPTVRLNKRNPILVTFHGGGWSTGHRDSMIYDFYETCETLRTNGFIVAAVPG